MQPPVVRIIGYQESREMEHAHWNDDVRVAPVKRQARSNQRTVSAHSAWLDPKLKLARKRRQKRALSFVSNVAKGDALAWSHLKGLAKVSSRDAMEWSFILDVKQGDQITWDHLKEMSREEHRAGRAETAAWEFIDDSRKGDEIAWEHLKELAREASCATTTDHAQQ